MKKMLKFAIVQTLPVFFGYLFLGFAFGLMLSNAGYPFYWALITSVLIYAGSGQFLLVSLLTSGASLVTCGIMTLLLNSRHIFYGLSFVERFREMGKAYPYMIFSLTDETYSLLCYTKIPPFLDRKKTTFTIALLNQLYWIMGCVLGALVGQLFVFNSTGVDFAMTALFTVIFVEQWLDCKNHYPALLGILSGVVSLLLFGPDNFILPSLIITVSILLLSKNFKERKKEEPTPSTLKTNLKENKSHGN